MPFFSIILPTYNRAHFLPKAIESVLAQTFEDWELVIVDDGSTDNTKEVVASYRDPRIVYIYQENQERSAARNNGISQATGEYICFLDSDDYYLPVKLNEYWKAIESKDPATTIFYDGLVFENDGIKATTPLPIKRPETSMYEFLLLNPIGPLQVCVPAYLFESQKFNPSLRIGEDVELWLRLAPKASFIPVMSYQTVALEHDDRSINLKKYDTAKEQLKQLDLIFQQYDDKQISRKVRSQLLSNCYFNSAKHYMTNDKKWKALIKVLQSLQCGPRNVQFRHRVYTLYKLITMRIPQEYKIK